MNKFKQHDLEVLEGSTTFALTEPILNKVLVLLGSITILLGIMKVLGLDNLFGFQEPLFYSLIILTIVVFYAHYKYNLYDMRRTNITAKRVSDEAMGMVHDLKFYRL